MAACGSSSQSGSASKNAGGFSSATATAPALPGAGKPLVTIGDKNFTEQFVLGELYSQALAAQGYSTVINRNIGPTEVTIQALQSGRLAMYPEYLGTWIGSVAGDQRRYATERSAYQAARAYALAHGLDLLAPTPFSNVDGIGVTAAYAQQNNLRSIGDLAPIAGMITLGAPPQFKTAAMGLAGLGRGLRRLPGCVQAARDRRAVPAAERRLGAGRRRDEHRSRAAERSVRAARRPQAALRLG